jgi:HAD superfamily hydrolase (TIGR01509 family)
MTPSSLAAVLFDMDGLLVDTEPLWLETETEVMARLGGPWSEADQEALLGGSMDRAVRYLLDRAIRPVPPATVAGWMLAGMLDRVRAGRVIVKPGARELLAEVAAAGLPHALVTSSLRSFAEAVLGATGMAFGVTVCCEDVTVTKPDPAPYLLAAKLLDVDPARCVALEDSRSGVESAGAAGCLVVAVPSVVPIPPGRDRVVVPSLRDVKLADLRSYVRMELGPAWRRVMSTYQSIAWFPIGVGLTAAGLVLSYLAGRRRGLRAMLRGAAWSLIPLAAYLTGAIEMLWKVGVAIGDFASAFAFSPEKWAGIGVTGVAALLFVVTGGRARRKAARGRASARAEAAEPAAGRAGKLAAGQAGKAPKNAITAVAKTRRDPAVTAADDDMKDVEAILRKRGIS